MDRNKKIAFQYVKELCFLIAAMQVTRHCNHSETAVDVVVANHRPDTFAGTSYLFYLIYSVLLLLQLPFYFATLSYLALLLSVPAHYRINALSRCRIKKWWRISESNR